MLDQSSTKFSDHRNKEYNRQLLTSMAKLQVELQGLQFLLSQGITMGQYKASVINFEMESLTTELRHLVTSTEEDH